MLSWTFCKSGRRQKPGLVSELTSQRDVFQSCTLQAHSERGRMQSQDPNFGRTELTDSYCCQKNVGRVTVHHYGRSEKKKQNCVRLEPDLIFKRLCPQSVWIRTYFNKYRLCGVIIWTAQSIMFMDVGISTKGGCKTWQLKPSGGMSKCSLFWSCATCETINGLTPRVKLTLTFCNCGNKLLSCSRRRHSLVWLKAFWYARKVVEVKDGTVADS